MVVVTKFEYFMYHVYFFKKVSFIIAVLAFPRGISTESITLESEMKHFVPRESPMKALHVVESILSRFKTDEIEEESDE